MKKTLIWIIVAIVLILAILFFYQRPFKKGPEYRGYRVNNQYQALENNIDKDNTSSSTNNINNNYNTNDISIHNIAKDCWAIINNKVYDLTSYVYKHPAGPEQIIAICGKDGSSLFDSQHGGNMKIEKMLSNFYKGDFIK